MDGLLTLGLLLVLVLLFDLLAVRFGVDSRFPSIRERPPWWW